MKKAKWYEIVGLVLFTMVLIFFIVNLLPITIVVERSVEGRQLAVGETQGEKVIVNIEGKQTEYLLNFFKEDYFQGKITMSTFPETQSENCFMFPIMWQYDFYNTYPLNKNVLMGNVLYGNTSSTNTVHGTVFQRNTFAEGVLFVTDAGIVVFPASDDIQANSLLKSVVSEDILAVMLDS